MDLFRDMEKFTHKYAKKVAEAIDHVIDKARK